MIKDLEIVAESRTLSENELSIHSNGLKRILELERMAPLDVKQKARLKWVVDGDENTNFFHGHVSNNKRKNQIMGLTINGRWSMGVSDIKKETYNFFQLKFMERWTSRPKIINTNFKMLSMMDVIRLEAPFSVLEVKAAV